MCFTITKAETNRSETKVRSTSPALVLNPTGHFRRGGLGWSGGGTQESESKEMRSLFFFAGGGGYGSMFLNCFCSSGNSKSPSKPLLSGSL